MSVTAASNAATTAATTTAAAKAGSSPTATEQSDRFLKLLVTQMQNQDPLNPLDNAQVTSQMAQISTVTGLEQLNTTVGGLNGQFVQMQALQGAALVGHDVAVQGNTLRQTGSVADAGFELASAASSVKVEILNEGGTVLDTLTLGATTAGRHSFNWNVPSAWQGSALNFRVSASAGTQAVESVPLTHQRIAAASASGTNLLLELANGQRIDRDAVWAFL